MARRLRLVYALIGRDHATTIPSTPLKFRTAGFPQYGLK
jgi:hypothetical protein